MSETKRKIFIVIVLVLVVLFGVGQFFAGSLNTANQQAAQNTQPQNTSPSTQVIAYAAPATFASSTPVENGSCFASSIAAPYRADAWRCAVGNAISDPCFEIPGSTSTLACGENPASTDVSSVFALKLTKPLPTATTPSNTPSNWAWLVELNDGTICTPPTGTLPPVTLDGQTASYDCAPGTFGTSTFIFGLLNNATSVWTAQIGNVVPATSTSPSMPPFAVSASATVPIFAAWQ